MTSDQKKIEEAADRARHFYGRQAFKEGVEWGRQNPKPLTNFEVGETYVTAVDPDRGAVTLSIIKDVISKPEVPK